MGIMKEKTLHFEVTKNFTDKFLKWSVSVSNRDSPEKMIIKCGSSLTIDEIMIQFRESFVEVGSVS